MLKKIKITNFKSFGDTKEINFAPITLLYGPNSSGKSSVIQSLLLLKQSMENRNQHAAPTFSGDIIDLGSYNTVVHKHDAEKDISFSIDYNSSISAEEHIFKTSKTPIFAKNDIRSLTLTYSNYEDGGASVNYLNKMSFSCENNMGNRQKIDFSIKNFKGKKYGIERKSTFKIEHTTQDSFRNFVINRLKKTHSNIETSSIIKSLDDEIHLSLDLNLPAYSMSTEGGEFLNSIFSQLFIEVKQNFEELKYLGPLRSAPKRFYSSINDGSKNIALKLSENQNVVKRINYWFNKFEIPYKIDIEDIGNLVTGKILSVQLVDIRTETRVTPADVGFGIGQVLPIIIEAVTNKNTTICVEQPEIHLHPRLQAHLADLFIDSVKNNNQWIIETHSEALLLRIQRRLRNNSDSISNKDILISYIDCSQDGAQVVELPLDEEGDFLKHWPDGFFEERLTEQFGD